MKKVTVTFEVTEIKTEVIATGTTDNIVYMDITGTEMEKDFVALMKKIQEIRMEKAIHNALDIETYKQIN